jgi:hypothetical protein
MKRVWYVSSEEEGEVEGMFTEDGELLDIWACNDASWRNEYFSGFLEKLGIEVKGYSNDPYYSELKEKLEAAAREMWG